MAGLAFCKRYLFFSGHLFGSEPRTRKTLAGPQRVPDFDVLPFTRRIRSASVEAVPVR